MHSKPRASQLRVSLKLFVKPELILSVVCGLKIHIHCVSPYFFDIAFFFFFDDDGGVPKNNVFLEVPCYSFNSCIFNHTLIINMLVSSLFAVAEKVCMCMGLLSYIQFYIL